MIGSIILLYIGLVPVSRLLIIYYCNHSILHTTAHAHNNYVCAPLRDVRYEYDFGDFKGRGGVLCLATKKELSWRPCPNRKKNR